MTRRAKTVRKAVKTKAERERREGEQTERTICLPLFDSGNRRSVVRRKISGEEKRERERERERKGKPEEEEEKEEERHFNDGWLTFASLARRERERERASSCCPQASKN